MERAFCVGLGGGVPGMCPVLGDDVVDFVLGGLDVTDAELVEESL